MSATVKSPCVNICALDDKDICTGCYRSSKEITEWQGLSDEQRLEVLSACDQRYKDSWA